MSKQTFVANTILTAAQLNTLQANDYNQTVSTKTASYTLVASDAGTRVVMNVASANTVTVNTSLFSAGDTLIIQNIGAGVTTVTAGTATVSSAGPLTIAQYGSGTLYFTSAGVSLWFPSAGPTASSGLTYITGGTFTTVSQGTVTGCFTSTYENYRIMLNCTLWEGDSYLLFGTGGTISSATNTDWSVINTSTGSVSGLQAANQSKALVCRNYSVGTLTIDIIGPNLADYTKYNGIYGGSNVGTSAINGSNGCLVKNSTQFTDFTIRGDAHPSASQSWTYKIYGYSNS